MIKSKGLIVAMVTAFFVIMTVSSNNVLADETHDKIIRKLNKIKWMLWDQVIPRLDECCGGVPKTGQDSSWSPGDDGDLQMGIRHPTPRFVDNGDGTVTDNLTGLMWTKDAQQISGQVLWPDAVTSCNNLLHAGYDDWRLPNVRELNSLMDYGTYNPALPSNHPFTNVEPHPYWSSSTYWEIPDYAWVGDMASGRVSRYWKGEYYFVWAVRGGR